MVFLEAASPNMAKCPLSFYVLKYNALVPAGQMFGHALAPYGCGVWQWWPLSHVPASAGQVPPGPDCPHSGDTTSTGNNHVLVSKPYGFPKQPEDTPCFWWLGQTKEGL